MGTSLCYYVEGQRIAKGHEEFYKMIKRLQNILSTWELYIQISSKTKLHNHLSEDSYILNIGLHFFSMDTSGFPDWAGSFIKKDDINGNCGLCVVEINEKTHYCYFANQPIPKGATIYFAG